MLDGLDRLDEDVRSGAFLPAEGDEDVHTALERGLIERAGPDLGGKLRAGRSRNDQIATLFRMYLREHAREVSGLVLDVVDALVAQAARHIDVADAGPHPPAARPAGAARPPPAGARLAAAARRRAAAGLGRAVRRSRRTARVRWRAPRWGWTRRRWPPSSASPARWRTRSTAPPARDFVAEFAFVAAMTAVDLSRLAEEVVLWATKEFAFVTLDDAYSTGSSIMPQKKNPDVAELARGKAGRLIGDLTGLLTTLKALPLAYNRDLQEDKEPVFDAVDTLEVLLPAFSGMVATLVFDTERLAVAGAAGLLAGHRRRRVAGPRGRPVPRRARGRRGLRARVRGPAASSCGTSPTRTWRDLSAHLTPDVRTVLTVEGSLASRNGKGGTAPERVREQLERCASGWPSWAPVRLTRVRALGRRRDDFARSRRGGACLSLGFVPSLLSPRDTPGAGPREVSWASRTTSRRRRATSSDSGTRWPRCASTSATPSTCSGCATTSPASPTTSTCWPARPGSAAGPRRRARRDRLHPRRRLRPGPLVRRRGRGRRTAPDGLRMPGAAPSTGVGAAGRAPIAARTLRATAGGSRPW